ncbi:CLUMA_CG013904, isoform A [Clunio marinus]|uniref:alpha-glucosidase n=1 Tax=Clunio marinus TaxID=568069 RepID=A0A1J1IM53_9DIPT|nr:CLUMA_CG013904, isoform A [Clunio marinus]
MQPYDCVIFSSGSDNKRLDHLKDAGMDACWLSPIFASPQVDTGYDVSDFYTIEPDYGNMADFDNLMAKAKELGINLLLDFIPNHTSDQHDWFIRSVNNESDYMNYYVWREPQIVDGQRTVPNNWRSVFGGPAWTWSESRQQYYLHQFSPQQPDLNYRNPKVVDEMKQVMQFYMEKGVSGFRLDAINHMFEDDQFRDEPRNEFVTNPDDYEYYSHIYTKDLQETFDLVYEWRKFIEDYVSENELPTDIILMTEAYASTYDTMRYYRDPSDDRRGAHMPFNFQLIFNFYNNAKAQNIKNGIDEWLNNMPEGETADWVAGSHDHSRVASRVGIEKVHMVNTVVLTLPGASVTYYGEEIGMQDYRLFNINDGRDPNRTPMQWNSGVGAGFTSKNAEETWLPIHPNYVTINLQAQREQIRSTYKYFQTLTALRKTNAFRNGSFEVKVVNENVLAFKRELDNEIYIVVINVEGSEERVDLSELWTISDEISVVTAAPNSRFDIGDKTMSNDVTLGLYDTVIFHVSHSTTIVYSLTLMIFSKNKVQIKRMKFLRIVGIFTVLLCVQLVTAQDDHDHDHEHDWWEHAVFYQIYPRSFKDDNNDGIGDIRGVINKLEHLKDLGVTGVWLSPIFASPMKDGGYDIADYENVNPMFGTNEDLEELFEKAKELGLKIILDFVPNHTSDQHEWFQKSVDRVDGFTDFYVWRDCPLNSEGNRTLPNNWIAVFHTPAWSYNEDRDQCYLHQFAPEQPDLNYRNPWVQRAMLDVLRYWMERGADGFRIDAINHMFEVEGLPDETYIDPNGDLTSYDNLYHNITMNRPESYEFIYEARKMMDEFVANSEDKVTRILMTEAYATVEQQALWYGESETILGSHMPFNFQLITKLDKDSNANEFKEAIDEWMNAMPDYGVANWVMGNHDRSRVGSRYGAERQDSLAIMTMALPGINVIYNGEEIGMLDYNEITWEETDDPQACQTNETVYKLYSRDPVRTPFQWEDTGDWAGFSEVRTWLPVNPNFRDLNLKAQQDADKSTYKLYKHLIALRSNHVLMEGDYQSKVISDNLFAFKRTLAAHNTIAVYVNLGNATNTKLTDLVDADELPEDAKVKILAVTKESNMEVDEYIEDLENIELGAYDAVILEISSATKIAIFDKLLNSIYSKYWKSITRAQYNHEIDKQVIKFDLKSKNRFYFSHYLFCFQTERSMKILLLTFFCVIIVNFQLSSSLDDHDLDWWEYGVLYQVYPNSFKDTDGDGRGDLKGIIENLEYFVELGVTGIWLNPIFKSPMKDGGYDVEDYMEINSRFGTNEDFDELLTKAHNLGLKVILDIVINHTSDEHEWFLKSANNTSGYEDFYIWRDCFNDVWSQWPNNWISVFHTRAWTYHPARNQCYLHQFTSSQPDLNFREPKVREELMKVLHYWLEKGADGFRFGRVNHLYEHELFPSESYFDINGDFLSYDNLFNTFTMNQPESYGFIYAVREMIDDYVKEHTNKATRIIMTEAYSTLPQYVPWFGEHEDILGSHLPFNFELITRLDRHSSASEFKSIIDTWIDALPTWSVANWVLGNHDQPRIASRYGNEMHESLAIMAMMLPGVNIIYYGEEIGMLDNLDITWEETDDPQGRQTNETVFSRFSRDPARTPFQWDDSEFAGFSNTTTWLPVNENYESVNLKHQREAEKSTFKLYKKLIEMRKENHVLAIGDLETKAMNEMVFGFMRTLPNHNSIAVIVNLGNVTVTASLRNLIEPDEFEDIVGAKILLVNNDSKLFVEQTPKQSSSDSEWWKSALFYQIYPRSFKDSNNDGIGDIRDIISKLQHLKDTGVTATWLSPIMKSPQVDFGYDISDYTQVDEIFGTNEDLEELFTEAHKLGIKVIMDFVPNHSSDQHEWFQKSVAREKGYENFYIWHDGRPNPIPGGRPLTPNNWISVFSHSAWTWNDEREAYYLHQFAPEQPDLNYREPLVIQAMKDVLTYWLDRGADGFRIDAIPHLFEDAAMRDEPVSGLIDDSRYHDYLTHIYTKDLPETYDMVGEWRRLIDDYNTENGGDTRVIFTEAFTSFDDTMKYYVDTEGNPRSHFPFNFFLITEMNETSTAQEWKAVIDMWMEGMPTGATPNWVVSVKISFYLLLSVKSFFYQLGNHDTPRFASRFGSERVEGLLTLLLMLPGVAVSYNGEEIGMLDYREISWEDTQDPQACNTNDPENYNQFSRDPVRTPFQWDDTIYAGFKDAAGEEPWLPVNPNYETLNLKQQQEATKSIYKFYQQLAQLRQAETFVHGDYKSTAINDNVFGFIRSLNNAISYVVLINFGSENVVIDINTLGVNFEGQSEIVLASSQSNYDISDIVSTTEFTLGAYDAIILTSSASVIATSFFIILIAATLLCYIFQELTRQHSNAEFFMVLHGKEMNHSIALMVEALNNVFIELETLKRSSRREMRLILLLFVCATVASADWWENAIFYQIYPRSFKDSNNDGIGDIKGIISKLQYLKDTGVTATWLSPILKSPQIDYGYDIADFTQVDEIFGTNEDLEELFTEAHKLGIKIIMDFVPNHTSNEHEWFKKSLEKEAGYEDFYVWHDGITNPLGGRPLPPNNWQAVFSTRAWTWNEQRQQYYLHQFASGQPDLNYRNPAVVQAMKDVLTYWMDRGADGFRIDAINHMFETEGFPNEPPTGWTDDPNNYGYTHHIHTKDLDEVYDMVRQWRVLIDEYNLSNGGDTRVLFTEAYATIEDTVRYYADESGNPVAHFPFNFILIERLDENSDAQKFKEEIDNWITAVPSGGVSNWVLGNHDKPRFGSRYGVERIDGMMMLLLTLPGVAVTYNGDEIGMLDYRDISWDITLDPQACNTNNPNDFKWASRDPERTPFQWDDTAYAGFKDASGEEPWLPVNPNYQTLNLKQQQEATKSFYKFYQKLAAFRNHSVFQNGDFESRAFNNEVFAYKRSYNGASFVVLINFGNNAYSLNIDEMSAGFSAQSRVAVAGSRSSYDEGVIVGTNLFTLREYDAVILEYYIQETTTLPTLPTQPATTTPSDTTETTTPTDNANTVIGSLALFLITFLLQRMF